MKATAKWLIIVALIGTTLSAFGLASSWASVNQVSTSANKTQDLFLLFQKANATISKIFHQFEEDSKTIPQASLDEYSQALTLAEESKNLFYEGNYSESNSKIIQALQKLKEALKIAYVSSPDQPTQTEVSLEMTIYLNSSINRYRDQLQQIEKLTRLAASVGYNTTKIEKLIQSIKYLLDRATSHVEQKRFEIALANLADAKNLIDQILSIINNFAVDLKTQRISTYINQTQERLNIIREIAESTSNEASLDALNSAETSLDNAKEYFEEQRLDETLKQLADSKASENEAVENLVPTATSLDSTSNTGTNVIQLP